MLSQPSRDQSVGCPSVYRAVVTAVIDGSLQTIHIALMGHTVGDQMGKAKVCERVK